MTTREFLYHMLTLEPGRSPHNYDWKKDISH
jgi:hypothetical protein